MFITPSLQQNVIDALTECIHVDASLRGDKNELKLDEHFMQGVFQKSGLDKETAVSVHIQYTHTFFINYI